MSIRPGSDEESGCSNFRVSACSPTAKTVNTRAELQRDEEQLRRFQRWVQQRVDRSIGILFTPWGEALIRDYYRDCIRELSSLPNVSRVAIQTNLSAATDELARGDASKVALWATYHPTQVSVLEFVERCAALDELGIAYSVGVVGLKEHFAVIEELRRALRPEVYVWVNAYKRVTEYYAREDVERLRRIDPYFDFNRSYYRTRGTPCRAGHTTFTVDGDGTARRCHFIEAPLGNIYRDDIALRLQPELCSNERCGCHIGYVHRPTLGLYELFGAGLLGRIPERWPMVQRDHAARGRRLALAPR